MAMVGWVGPEMEVVDGIYAGQRREGGGLMSGDAEALPECEVKTPDHTAFQVHSSG